MKAHRAAHSIATLCRVLEVSPSGYYAWHRRTPSPRGQEDASLTAEIEAIHTHSRGTYGVPRCHAELVARGRRVGRKRVTRLMRAARLRGVSRRKFVVTTTRAAEARPAPDLVRRAFTATGPDQLWCQGRSKIRPRWRRKTRPAGHWTECLKAAVRGKASGPRGGRVLAGVLAVCEAIAVAVQLQDVDVMGESVEECPG